MGFGDSTGPKLGAEFPKKGAEIPPRKISILFLDWKFDVDYDFESGCEVHH